MHLSRDPSCTSATPAPPHASWLARLGGLARRPVFGVVRGERQRPPRADLDPTQACVAADPALPAVQASSLLAANAELLGRLRVAGGNDVVFERLHRPAIDALARLVHLLPASARAHFAEPGGLLRYRLESALMCTQAATCRIAALTDVVRPRHAPQWRHAVFLAGLVADVAATLERMVVRDDSGHEWNCVDGPLDTWLDDRQVQRYHVHWRSPDAPRNATSRPDAARLLAHVIPPASAVSLEEGAPAIMRELYAVLLGEPRAADSPLGDLVNVVRRELLRREAMRRAPVAGAYLGQS